MKTDLGYGDTSRAGAITTYTHELVPIPVEVRDGARPEASQRHPASAISWDQMCLLAMQSLRTRPSCGTVEQVRLYDSTTVRVYLIYGHLFFVPITLINE